MGALTNWTAFCKERFDPLTHSIMILCFVAGNTALASGLYAFEMNWLQFALAYVVTFSYFFRLRCFDEIKDYEFDVLHNPSRPLARGLLSLKEVKIAITLFTIFEAVMVKTFAPQAMLMYLIAMIYSFIMYKEFFIGRWIRPHLTTYAVLHTFSSALIGYAIMSITSDISNPLTNSSAYLFALINWGQFNLFEFARKTFAPAEEKPNVDSYSSLFKPLGAALLSISQITLSWVALYALPSAHYASFGNLALAIILAGFAFRYAKSNSATNARLFRNVTSAYLLLFYLVIVIAEVI